MRWDTRAEHGTASRYRAGCHCGPCRAAHREDTYRYRTSAAESIPAEQRREIRRLLKSGATPSQVARALGIPWQRIYALARIDPAVAALLQSAE